jgi:peptidoglycan-associated lipoprotein
MSAFRRSAVAVVLTVVSVVACKAKPAPPPAPVAPPPAPSAPKVNQDSIDAARRAADETARRAAADAEARRLAEAIAAVRATLAQAVYFDYDKDDIRDDQRGTLDAKVPLLTANPALRIRVGGHTDNRGSDEYNLALGQRRSASAKRYLVSRGIAENRIETVSFGEERPAAAGDAEDSHARNRRDEFEIIAGADSIKAPK